MMYSEFINISGKSESYISFVEYSTFIEPVYMECRESKRDFCCIFNRIFSKIVPPLVERAIENLSTKEKFDYLNKEGDYDEVVEKLDKIDLEARKLVYQYLKLYRKVRIYHLHEHKSAAGHSAKRFCAVVSQDV